MLHTIRTKTASWIARGLFVILIAAFGAWGIGDIFRSGGRQAPVVKVGSNYQYSQAQFQHDLRQELEKLNRTTRAQFTTQQFAALGGVERLIQRAIDGGLLRAYVTKQGISAPSSLVVADIQKEKLFQNELGQFDRARFLQLLSQLGTTEKAYVETRQADAAQRWLLNAYFAPITAPQIEAEQTYRYAAEQRSAIVLQIPAESMKLTGTPDDSSLQAFFSKHQEHYRTPEYKSVAVALLKPEDFIKDVSVSDEEIAQEYAARKAEFSVPEHRDIEQILLPDEAQAQKIYDAIKGGASFADAIDKELKAKPIHLGKVERKDLPKDIAETAFMMKQGEVSMPLKSTLGYHLLHLLSVEPEQTKPLDQVKEELRQRLALAQAGDNLADMVNQIEDNLAGGTSLEEAAGKANIKLQEFQSLAADGMTADGKNSGLPAEALTILWGDNNTDQAQQLSDGSYFLFDIKGTQPPQDKPLAQVKDRVLADYQKEEQAKAAAAKAKELANSIKSAGDLEAAARILGLTIVNAPVITRAQGAPDQGINQALAQQIFATTVNHVIAGQNANDGIVAFVTAVKEADMGDAAYKNYTDRLTQSLQNDLGAAFLQALQQQIPVTVRRDLTDKFVQE